MLLLRQDNYLLLCTVLVGTLKEDGGENLGPWTRKISTPTRNLEWLALTISTQFTTHTIQCRLWLTHLNWVLLDYFRAIVVDFLGIELFIGIANNVHG